MCVCVCVCVCTVKQEVCSCCSEFLRVIFKVKSPSAPQGHLRTPGLQFLKGVVILRRQTRAVGAEKGRRGQSPL